MLTQEFHDEVWWPRCEERLREVTLESYNCCWKNHIAPAMAHMDLKDITPRFLDKWIRENNITPSVWRVTKAFIRTAYKYEEIDRDPCDRCLNAPPRKRPNPPTLSYDQMQELMDGLIDTNIYTTICCSCYCGLRREESCALEWSDFEWGIEDGELSYLNITKGVQYIHGREIMVEPKTILSRRRIPLPHELVRRIYPYRKENGRLLGKWHVHQAADFYRECTKARKLPHVPMSNLRTSWATYMVNTGAPISLISRYMGHADVETTVRWYTKPSETELIELTSLWNRPSKNKYDSDRPELMKAPQVVEEINQNVKSDTDMIESIAEIIQPDTSLIPSGSDRMDTSKLKTVVGIFIDALFDHMKG